MLIDNFDKSFHYPNSLFLPQTYIHERIYMGNGNIRHPMSGQLAGWSHGKSTRVRCWYLSAQHLIMKLFEACPPCAAWLVLHEPRDGALYSVFACPTTA